MAAGTTYKQCSCRDDHGRRLGQKCAKLRRANGTWSSRHGTWYYQVELPPNPDGSRRNPLRRGGFATQDDAEQELAAARDLLAIAAPGDVEGRIQIADVIQRAVKTTRQLPDPAAVRKATRLGHDPGAAQVTVGQWLDEWLAAKKDLRAGTVRSYEPHIRLYFKPHIGHIRLNRLRVADVASVFDAIDERNDAIAQARASGDPAQLAAVNGRRIVGPATKQRIRATLRSALGTYMKQHPGMLDVNVAALVSLPSGKRPKPLLWTGGRVRAWQHDFQARLAAARTSGRRVSPLDIWLSTPRPSPVMVWTPAQTKVFLTRARSHPPVRPVPPDRLPGAAARRGVRAGPRRHRPGRVGNRHPLADHPARLGDRASAPEIRGRRAARRPRRPDRRGDPRPPRPARPREEGDGRRLGRVRVRVHQSRRQPAAPGRRDRDFRADRLPGRAAAHQAS